MNLKRGILIALILYVTTMIIGVALTIITKINLLSPQDIPTTYWIITIITTVILTSLASILYFNKAKRNSKEGLNLGITFVITGFIIDILLFLTQKRGVLLIKQYYSNISFYIVLVLVVATCVFIGSQNHNYPYHSNVKSKSSKKNKVISTNQH
jgi:uncharacterized membrane protein YfcA